VHGSDRSYLAGSEEAMYATVPASALWNVATYLELAPDLDYAANEYDAEQERAALIDELLLWGAEQKERRLALASKLEWEPYKDVEDLSTLTDMQEAERVACERCGFIFKMYHADSWFSEIADMARKLVRFPRPPRRWGRRGRGDAMRMSCGLLHC
jgi:hypothetical protein